MTDPFAPLTLYRNIPAIDRQKIELFQLLLLIKIAKKQYACREDFAQMNAYIEKKCEIKNGSLLKCLLDDLLA